jgi:hypothetical protein
LLNEVNGCCLAQEGAVASHITANHRICESAVIDSQIL